MTREDAEMLELRRGQIVGVDLSRGANFALSNGNGHHQPVALAAPARQ